MYELTIWQNEYEKYEVATNYLTVTSEGLSVNSQFGTNVLFNDGKKGISVFDVSFDSKVKTADRQDYRFAILSGAIAAAFDQYAVGRTDLSKIKDFDKKELFSLAKNVLKFYEFADNSINDLQNKYEEGLDFAEGMINKAPRYKELAKDFSNSFSIKGLFFALFAATTGFAVGQNENGVLALTEEKNKEMLKDKNIFQKIELGFIFWIFEQAEQYNRTGKFEEEINDLVVGKNILQRLREIVKELASSKLFKDKTLDKTEIYRIVSTKVSEDTKDVSEELENLSLTGQLTKQIIPVLVNKCFVRTYLFLKLLTHDLKEKNVKSLDGLSLLNISVSAASNKRVLARMDTVSSGVFLAFDGTEALYYASKEAKKAAEMAAVLTPGDEKVRAAAAVAAGIRAGVFAYASSINVANVFNFVAVVKADSQYLIEDVKDFLDKNTIAGQKALEEANKQNQKLIIDATKLTKVETKILYSLKLDLIKYDIQNTKDSETQVDKNKWKDAWIEFSEKATDINKLFYDDQEKVYAQLKTKIVNEGDIDWVYRIVLELMRFNLYTPLDEEDHKKYSKLKPTKQSYLENVFCQNQNFVPYKEIEEMEKQFKKYYGAIGGSAENMAKGALGALLVTVLTGFAAFTFAPAIAVALLGGSGAFAGLSGAALTSAALAAFGGGAIAAGGLGMAGGTIVIAGGGALLGLGASGATLASLMVLSSSALVQEDYAKLLTNCDYILLKKYSKTREVIAIQKQVEASIKDYEIQLELIKNSDGFDNKTAQKKLIKEMEKSLDVVEKSNKILQKMIKTHSI